MKRPNKKKVERMARACVAELLAQLHIGGVAFARKLMRQQSSSRLPKRQPE